MKQKFTEGGESSPTYHLMKFASEVVQIGTMFTVCGGYTMVVVCSCINAERRQMHDKSPKRNVHSYACAYFLADCRTLLRDIFAIVFRVSVQYIMCR